MDNEACKVQGHLAFVLRLSRVLGTAPLHLAPERSGYTATVSRRTAIYGAIFALFCHICVITNVSANIFHSKVFPTSNVFNPLTLMIATGIGSYGGMARMKQMIKHSAALYKINHDINGSDDIQHNNKFTAIFPPVAFIVYITILVLSEYFGFNKKQLFNELVSFFAYTEYFKLFLMELENILIDLDVHCVLQTITTKLRHMCNNTDHANLSAATCRSVCKSVHDLARAYVSICALVKSLNASRGAIMFLLFTTRIILFMFTFFHLIDSYFEYAGQMIVRINFSLQLIWCVVHLLPIVLFIEPWHLIHEEVTEIQVLLTKLMINVTPVGKPIPLKLELMFKQLLLNKPTMSPLRMFSIQRSLFVTIIGFITTYNGILIQINYDRWRK